MSEKKEIVFLNGGRCIGKTKLIEELKKASENFVLDVVSSRDKMFINVDLDIHTPKGNNFYIKDGILLQSIKSREIR